MFDIEFKTEDTFDIDISNKVQEITPPLVDLEVTPSGEQQVFNHEGEFGYDKVTVEGVKLQDKTISPSRSQEVVVADDSYSGLSQVTINPVTSEIDSNIQSSNIKTGVNILGVDGTLEPAKPKQNKEATPSKEEQVITADEGYDLGRVTVSGDSDLAPQNIKEGANIFGVEGTAKVSGYEYAEFDPVNIIDLLDNDTEPYSSKAVIMLVNQGINSYDIKYSDICYASGDLIRGSDGGELTVSTTTQTYTFDESKDLVNSLGQRLRYFIVYKKSRDVSGSKPSYVNDAFMYYFKNCTVDASNSKYFPNSNGVGKVIEFDKDCNMESNTANMTTNIKTIIKFEMPEIYSTSYNGLASAFYGCYALKKGRLNLINSITDISQACGDCYALEDLLLINCPEETVNCSSFLNRVYGLKKFVAKPILKPADMSNPFGYTYPLEILSGIDFSNITSSWTLSACPNLTLIENVANINMNLTVKAAVKLTHNSIMNLINALVDLTGQTAKTLTLGTINLAKISDEEKAIATSKNWNLA